LSSRSEACEASDLKLDQSRPGSVKGSVCISFGD